MITETLRNNNGWGLLTGLAGTGKSTVSALAIKEVFSGANVAGKPVKLCIVGPTHKCVFELKKKLQDVSQLADQAGGSVTFRTLASLLKVTPVNLQEMEHSQRETKAEEGLWSDIEEQQFLERQKEYATGQRAVMKFTVGSPLQGGDKQDTVDEDRGAMEFNAILIDETSLISLGMYRKFCEVFPQSSIPVVWVGDRGQLKPVPSDEVKDSGIPSFVGLDLDITNPLRRVHLSQIVRQAADNPIISVAHKISKLKMVRSPGDVGAVWKPAIGSVVRTAVEEVSKDWSNKTFITFTNSHRVSLAAAVRNKLWQSAREPQVGESVMIKQHMGAFKSDVPMVACDVRQIEEIVGWMYDDQATWFVSAVLKDDPLHDWDMARLNRQYGESTNTLEFRCELAEKNALDYTELNKIAYGRIPAHDKAHDMRYSRSQRTGKPTRLLNVSEWFYGDETDSRTYRVAQNKDDCVYVRMPYAITCHTAQGSQWEKVFIRPGSQRQSDWHYTAITRAAKEAVYLVD